MLVVACGYLFDGLIVVPHAQTFPGVFSPDGLLGAGSQLQLGYTFFGTGVCVFVAAYGVVARSERDSVSLVRVRPAAVGAILATIVGNCNHFALYERSRTAHGRGGKW